MYAIAGRLSFSPEPFAKPLQKALLILLFVLQTPLQGAVGTLDLSLLTPGPDQIMDLEGAWDFYPRQLLTPRDLPAYSPETQRVPGGWEGPGWGTYRLRVLIPEMWRGRGLGFYSREINTSARFFINGKEAFSLGSPSDSRERAKPASAHFLYLPDKTERDLDILVQVSNYELRNGGLIQAPQLGLYESLVKRNQTEYFINNIIMGAVFIMMFYFLLVFFIRTHDKSPLFFSLFAFLALFRSLLADPYLYSWFDAYDLILRMEYASFFLIILSVILFIHSLYPEEIHPVIIRMNLVLSLVLSVAVFIFPLIISSSYLNRGYQLLTLIQVVYVVVQMTKAFFKNRPEIKIFCSGVLFLMLSAVNDVLYYARILPTLPITPYGFLIFVFFQAALMTIRYNRAFVENQELKQGLEDQVEKRTAELNSAMRALEEVSLTDPLTGLRNRRYVYEIFFKESRAILDRAQFNLEHPEKRQSLPDKGGLVVLMMDIDHFKITNDEYGHSVGDLVLKQFAQVLLSCIRLDDLVIRWGGEEFLVVLKNLSWEESLLVAEKIRSRIAETKFYMNESQSSFLTITTSVGVATLPFLKEKPLLAACSQVIVLADTALYSAKSQGRNLVVSAVPGGKIHELEDQEVWNWSRERLVKADVIRVVTQIAATS